MQIVVSLEHFIVLKVHVESIFLNRNFFVSCLFYVNWFILARGIFIIINAGVSFLFGFAVFLYTPSFLAYVFVETQVECR